MCRCVCLLVLLLSISETGLSSSSAVTPWMNVIPGQNLTLHCNISPSTEMVWYRHNNDELTMIISFTKGNVDKEPAVNYNKDSERFHLFNQEGSGLSLIITDIRQSDIGLYYCGARQEGMSVNFAKAINLHFTDTVKYIPGSAQCWTPLISACCAFALILTFCLGIIYKRGFSLCSCMKCVKDNDTKETDVQYASLRHNATPRERRTPHANQNVTYDVVAKKITKSPRV